MNNVKMSPRTDLTLNRDFSRSSVSLRGTPLDRETIETARQVTPWGKFDLTSHAMANLFRTYFGSEMGNDYWKVKEQWFIAEGVGSEYATDSCYRCGKPVRIPWGRENRELCNDCSRALVEPYLRLPWKLSLKSSRNDHGEALFNSL